MTQPGRIMALGGQFGGVLTRRFGTSSKYDPNVVNACVNPRPGLRFPSVPILFGIASMMLLAPCIVTYFDTIAFKREVQARPQSQEDH